MTWECFAWCIMQFFLYCSIAECLIKYQACFGKIWAAKGKEFILHTLISLSLAPQMLLQDLYVDLVAISCRRSACCLLHIDSVHKSESNANIDLMLISKSLHNVSNYLSRGSRLPDSDSRVDIQGDICTCLLQKGHVPEPIC